MYYNLFPYSGSVHFPSGLQQYGLTEELLKKAFTQSMHGLNLCWSLKEIPTVGFYRELHNYLKKWSEASLATRTTIGNFYIGIGPELQKISSSSRPDNIYKFIERVALSKKPHSSHMLYGVHTTVKHLQKEINGCSTQIKELSAKLSEREDELSRMKSEIEMAREEVTHTKDVLKVSTKLRVAHKQHDCARQQTQKIREKLEATIADHVHFEGDLLEKNSKITKGRR